MSCCSLKKASFPIVGSVWLKNHSVSKESDACFPLLPGDLAKTAKGGKDRQQGTLKSY